MARERRYDVVVVGGGPAGLSGALVLARARLAVALVDAGEPRNAAAPHMHAFLGRDGLAPLELVRAGREEIGRYGVPVYETAARDATRDGDGFSVALASGERLHCRRLLLATGVRDPLPSIPGLQELFGVSVHHCPFCDGWEERDRPIAVLGRGGVGARFAIKLKRWSDDVVLVTNGPSRLRLLDRERLAAYGIAVRSEAVERLEGEGGRLSRVVFAEGEPLARGALFFVARPRQRSDLAARLGARFTRKGMVRADHRQATDVPGLFVAGDASRDVQLAVVAAAEGVKAAVAIVAGFDEERVARPPVRPKGSGPA
jgi:thioredoxin reductase